MEYKWETKPLGELVTFSSGGTPSKKNSNYWGGTIPWISAKTMKDERISTSDLMITEEGLRAGSKLAPAGSVLLLTRGSGLFNGIPVCLVEKPVAFNQDVKCMEASGAVSMRFIFYWLKSQADYLKAKLDVTGIGAGKFDTAFLKELQVPVPSAEEQNKIVAIADAISNRIAVNRKINDNLQQQAQTLFAERFCLRGGTIPEDWTLVSLGDVAVISNKSFNPLKQPETMLEHYSIPAFDETRYPVFELSTAIKSNKFVVDADCFMISKLNPTTKRVWRPYCMTDNAVCSTEFIVYKAKKRELTDFLYSLIDSASFSDFMCSHVTGSTGSRQRTTPSDTLQYQFYMPTGDEIADFSAVVAPMYAKIRINALENARLKGLRDSLLPHLMSGDVDVSEDSI